MVEKMSNPAISSLKKGEDEEVSKIQKAEQFWSLGNYQFGFLLFYFILFCFGPTCFALCYYF